MFTCNYQIPPPPSGKKLDFGLVNVQIALAGLNPELIGQVPNKEACPALCKPMEDTANSRLDVLIGCETKVDVR